MPLYDIEIMEMRRYKTQVSWDFDGPSFNMLRTMFYWDIQECIANGTLKPNKTTIDVVSSKEVQDEGGEKMGMVHADPARKFRVTVRVGNSEVNFFMHVKEWAAKFFDSLQRPSYGFDTITGKPVEYIATVDEYVDGTWTTLDSVQLTLPTSKPERVL
jgi:hypothetical protein